MRSALIAFAGLAVAGCETLPDVSYRVATSPGVPATPEITSYAMQETTLAFSAGDEGKVGVAAGRTEFQGARIQMLDSTSAGVDPNIGVVNYDNTDIPKEITVKVEDGRKELVENIGGLITTAVGVAKVAFSASGVVVPTNQVEITVPSKFNLSEMIADGERAEHKYPPEKSKKADKKKADESSTDKKSEAPAPIRVVFGPVPVDAIERGKLAEQKAGSYFYYAACRTADVGFRYNGVDQQTSLKVSDPNFLQRVRLPYDGKVTMHSQCGASVTGKLKGADGAEIALIQALIEQANAVKEAIEKDEDSGEEGGSS